MTQNLNFHINLNDNIVLYFSTAFFVLAVIHTFLTNKIIKLSHYFKKGSPLEKLFHYLGEVEIVFGLWAFVFLLILTSIKGISTSIYYLNNLNFTEPIFVFVIMCICATKPIIQLTNNLIDIISSFLPFSKEKSFYISVLTVGPLLGSFITEPAAMTVSALLLKERIFDQLYSTKFKYASLGLLFVNISIGGVLTNFAAPPILVVAHPWNWTTTYVFQNFGWKSIIIVTLSTLITSYLFRKEFKDSNKSNVKLRKEKEVPIGIKISHALFIMAVVYFHTDIVFFVALFLVFLGWYKATKKYQSHLKIRESLLVGFFLAGLVALGSLQSWWLTPFLTRLSHNGIFWGSTILTAVTDNAAITYLSTLVPNLNSQSKYAIVTGAITGGGLTVIANAPNPSGYGILTHSFGEDGIKPAGLFLGALPYTLLAAIIFLFL